MNSIQSVLSAAYDVLKDYSDSPHLDAELLLCQVLKKNRAYLRGWPEHELSLEQHNSFLEWVQKRKTGQPIAYLIGHKEFWSRNFIINSSVLVPRPETELLVELALKLIPENQTASVIDLGTGSGAIGVTMAAERSDINVIATDTSLEALEIAKLNAQKHQVRNVKFRQSFWLKSLEAKKFNLVLSNPPYIDPTDPHLQQGDIRFEPKTALISKQNGLQDIIEITDTAREHLLPGGYLLIEHGYNQKQAVQSIFKQFNYTNISNYSDLAGQPRVTKGQWQK